MLRALLQRGLLFTLLWWVLVEGQLDNWGLGVLAILAALAASLRLLPASPQRLRLSGLLGYLAFFAWNSIKGATQVSLLALRGRTALQPAILEWQTNLPPGAPRLLMLNTLGLMPGTVVVVLHDARMRIHVIDQRLPIQAELTRLQTHIARIFGVPP